MNWGNVDLDRDSDCDVEDFQTIDKEFKERSDLATNFLSVVKEPKNRSLAAKLKEKIARVQ